MVWDFEGEEDNKCLLGHTETVGHRVTLIDLGEEHTAHSKLMCKIYQAVHLRFVHFRIC